jgi:ABC-type oligopeptide transport system substrate-binding subunit
MRKQRAFSFFGCLLVVAFSLYLVACSSSSGSSSSSSVQSFSNCLIVIDKDSIKNDQEP